MPGRYMNVNNSLLVNRDNKLFPLLYTKLGFIKQFTKDLDRDGGYFNYLYQAGIFDGPQIPKLIPDQQLKTR